MVGGSMSKILPVYARYKGGAFGVYMEKINLRRLFSHLRSAATRLIAPLPLISALESDSG